MTARAPIDTPVDRLLRIRDKLMVADAALTGAHAITGSINNGIQTIIGDAYDELTGVVEQIEKKGWREPNE